MKPFLGKDVPFQPADPQTFIGSARVKRFPLVDGDEQVIVYLVDFEPGARTNWHRHSAPQLLLVLEGRGLLQKWGEPTIAIAAGDTITIEPDEKHWHGAAPDSKMAHFAVNLNLTTQWLEPVADADYRAS
jgi:quercetin dioxygenase-like cupin family protein